MLGLEGEAAGGSAGSVKALANFLGNLEADPRNPKFANLSTVTREEMNGGDFADHA
jgi:hypothetical protein